MIDATSPFGNIESEDNWKPAVEPVSAPLDGAVTTHTEAPVSINEKVGNFLVTLRFSTQEEAIKGINEYLNEGLKKTLLAAAPEATKTMPSAPAQSSGWGNTAPEAPVERWETDYSCPHGTLVFNQWGKSKFGTPFQAFQCPEGVASRGQSGCKDANGRTQTVWLSQAKKEGRARKVN